jgi:hypothetical protein
VHGAASLSPTHPQKVGFPFGRHVIFCAPVDGGIDAVRMLHSAREVDAAMGDEQQAAGPGSRLNPAGLVRGEPGDARVAGPDCRR